MSTIQDQMQLFHALEVALRRVAEEKSPMTIRDLHDIPAVKQVSRGELQVRDKVKTLLDKGLLTKVTVAESQAGDKRGRIGFYWRDPEKTSDLVKVRNGKKHETVPVPVPTDKNIELVINGMTIVVGKNPETGRLRIVIE